MPLRWGIVTAAKICHDFVNAFNSYPGNDKEDVIAAVAARDKTKAAAFAKLHNIPQVFDSYHALAASDAIDIAYIGAINPYHYQLAKLFLEHGKHVLCEKPLCMNFKQAQSLVNLAQAKKLFLMEAVWSRCTPSYKALDLEIQSGKLGDIQFVEANFGLGVANVDRVTQKALGGSALLDLGIYNLQFAQFIFKDEPKRVTAISELNEFGIDMVDTVVLEYEGCRRAVLNISFNHTLWNKATVVGTKGRITLEEPFHVPTDVIQVDGTNENFPLHASKIPFNFGLCSAALVYEALEVSRCIKAGKIECPLMTHKESLNLAKLEDTIRQQIGVHFDVDDQEFP